MPAWLVSALRMLGAGLAAGTGFEIAEGVLDTGVGGFTGRSTGQGFFGLGGGEPRKRRRRRRALTASDRADIAFIVGLLGPAAGKNFAVTLAGRGR